MELTCPLDSEHHLKEARIRKQNKVEYLQLLAEFDRVNRYETIEISVLGPISPAVYNNSNVLLILFSHLFAINLHFAR